MTVEELEAYFEGIDLPESVYLNKATKIVEVKKFIKSHLITVKAHGHIKAYSSFLDRLIQLKDILEAQRESQTIKVLFEQTISDKSDDIRHFL